MPAYSYPSVDPARSDWDELAAAARVVPLIAIASPEHGPGAARNPDFVLAIAAVRAAGGEVFGYIDTDHAMRAPAAVQRDVDTWLDWYDVSGFFFDDVVADSTRRRLDYYADLHAYVKARGALTVAARVDTAPPEGWLTRPAADIFVIDLGATELPRWAASHPSRRFAAIASHVREGDMTDVVMRAAQGGLGWIYAGGHDATARLPPWFDDEVALVRTLHRPTAAVPLLPGRQGFLLAAALACAGVVAIKRKRR